MTSFPRPLPDGIAFRVVRFAPDFQVTAARSGARAVNISEVNDPFWVVELRSVPLTYHQWMAFKSWYASLGGGVRKVVYRNLLARFPAAHPNGAAGPAATNGSLVSLTDGHVLAVQNVHAGLVLAVGDLIGIEATKRTFALVREASGSGTTRTLVVDPAPPADIAVAGATIRFIDPSIVMAIVPGSLTEAQDADGRWTVSFSLQETD